VIEHQGNRWALEKPRVHRVVMATPC
jgi:hypothetical protein